MAKRERPAHALFGASGSYKWLGCSAALAMEKGRPDKTSAAAVQGTMMHKVGECCLLNRISPLVPGVEGGTEASFYIGCYPLATPEDGKAGPQFPEELVAPVDAYVNRVWKSYTSHRRNLLFIEQRVNYSNYIGQPNSFGTADAIVLVWLPKLKAYRLEIHDFKGGVYFQISADNNSQLMLYALGALRRLQKKYTIAEVTLVIHQGRVTEVASEWDVDAETLLKFADYAKERAKIARDCLNIPVKDLTKDMFSPSEAACRWCKASEECNAHAKYISNLARSGNLPKAVHDMPILTDEDFAVLSAAMPEIERWVSNMKDTLMQRMLSGKEIPGRKLVVGRAGSRTWKNERRAARLLRRAGLEAKEVLMTPAQAEKALKKHPDVWEKLKGQIETGEPSLVIVDRRDPRPKYGIALKSDFENLE
ncbi:hypothetical protein CPT_Scapp_054 [Serratia phage Scapp]|uniref:DUF2800 domain-containing protein n=1 Tax=Serratia phage Scapp TaxID=2282409 RepID=A0A345L6T1_9CAUD|nr:exonuclease [Serratia phage Scapp]AXH50983.1 hypothetical protein CPT_Scapp_054 [Serratia phage Scapp]